MFRVPNIPEVRLGYGSPALDVAASLDVRQEIVDNGTAREKKKNDNNNNLKL